MLLPLRSQRAAPIAGKFRASGTPARCRSTVSPTRQVDSMMAQGCIAATDKYDFRRTNINGIAVFG